MRYAIIVTAVVSGLFTGSAPVVVAERSVSQHLVDRTCALNVRRQRVQRLRL